MKSFSSLIMAILLVCTLPSTALAWSCPGQRIKGCRNKANLICVLEKSYEKAK